MFRHCHRVLAAALLAPLPALAQDPGSDDVVMRALVDEMNRSMSLQLEDLGKPYFIRYSADDSVRHFLSATHGGIQSADRRHVRTFEPEIRVGSHDLDNTNFQGDMFGFGFGGGGGQTSLPLDDDYLPIRQAIWLATDASYKSAVETLTQKRAYLEQKKIEDRPADFTKTDPTNNIEPRATLELDDAEWRRRLKWLSARFEKFAHVRDSQVSLTAAADNRYIATSEGTRVRTGETRAKLSITANAQAEDGEQLADSVSYRVATLADLPPIEKIGTDIDALAERLQQVMRAPILESYTGPVLFDAVAAGQVFEALFARGVVGRPEPVGSQRRAAGGAMSLERRLGRRVLPSSFRVYDDPAIAETDGSKLAGHYEIDDEGVEAQRVEIVAAGVLKTMVMSRVPTKKVTGSNGHGRNGSAAIGNLFIENGEGVDAAELKAELIEAAQDEGLEFAIKVTALRKADTAAPTDIFALLAASGTGGGDLPDPLYVYKVWVKDGREELVRGCEFGDVTVRSLRRILASGKEPGVYNMADSAVIAPAVVFEELELTKIEQEHDKKPILAAPHVR